MFRFSKKVEYAILALQFMAARSNEKITAKQLSEALDISFEFLSKTLQILMKNGLIVSHQGVNGGYNLAKKADEISITDVVKILENRVSIVDCMIDNGDICCDRTDNCTIRDPMQQLQTKVDLILNSTTIAELAKTVS